MCGRFSLDVPQEEIEAYFDARFADDGYKPRYNAAPTQALPAVVDEDPSEIRYLDWGLHPSWFKPDRGLINLKAETMAQKPFMRRFLSRRCLIPATGFFEWKKGQDKNKIPYRIFIKDRPLFSFAGVWEPEKDASGNLINRFAIITTAPNELASSIHNRMPAILSEENEKKWLLKDLPAEYALHLLGPYPAGEMDAYEISAAVNNPKNDSAKILLPERDR